MTVKEFLTGHNLRSGYPVDNDALIETLIEEGNIIKRSGHDVHRWYVRDTVIAEVNGTFIQYTDYTITGDNCMSDMGLHYDLDAAKIVERKEREVIEVYYE